jgi:hypothetical protein
VQVLYDHSDQLYPFDDTTVFLLNLFVQRTENQNQWRLRWPDGRDRVLSDDEPRNPDMLRLLSEDVM